MLHGLLAFIFYLVTFCIIINSKPIDGIFSQYAKKHKSFCEGINLYIF